MAVPIPDFVHRIHKFSLAGHFIDRNRDILVDCYLFYHPVFSSKFFINLSQGSEFLHNSDISFSKHQAHAHRNDKQTHFF